MKIPPILIAGIVSAICIYTIEGCHNEKQIELVSDTVSMIPHSEISEAQRIELIEFYSDKAAKFDRRKRFAKDKKDSLIMDSMVKDCQKRLFELTK